MGNRLTQIATRTGDNGTTGLGNNQRVSKNSLRVHAMGEVDELSSNIGVLLCEDMAADVREVLVEVQHQLFNLGGELSIPGFELLKVEAVAALDEALEKYNAQLPKLEEFILPAGTRGASQAHVCRTVARRAERACVALGNEEAINETPAIDPASACFSCLFRRREVVPRTAYVHAGKIFGPVGACCSEDRRLSSLSCSYRRRRSRLHEHFQSTDKAACSSKK